VSRPDDGQLAHAADAVLGVLLRPRLRRVLRWSFVITLPAGAFLLRERGLDAAVAIVLLELCGFIAVMLVALRLGGERRAVIFDLIMHPAVRRVLRSEMRVAATVPVALVRRLSTRRAPEFGYARGDQELAIALALTPAILAETAAVHLLLPASLGPVKLAVLLVSLYGLLWLVSWAVGLCAFPHLLEHDHFRARLGQLYEVRVPLDAIRVADVRPEVVGRRTEAVVEGDRGALAVGGRVSVHLELDRPVCLHRPFGEPRPITRLSLAADDPAGLLEHFASHRASS
jgi:hypothetical protein